MKKELTERQLEILNFIRESIEINGYPPTYREIGRKFNISSTFGVKRHIDALIKKGYLNSESNASRTLSVINLSGMEKAEEKFFEIPVVGRVAAGYPILAEENIEGNLLIDASFMRKNPDSFGLKVRGDSMIKAGILEGDVVIVAPQKNAKNGDIIVALLGDEATMKRYMRKKDEILLIPENDNYSPIEVNKNKEFSIIGKVMGVFRSYN
jgi:repressor LexA